MDPEEGVSAPSTPATPGNPGAPLFGGFKHERKNTGNGKKSLLKSFKYFSVEPWASEEGTLPAVSCMLPPPPVSLARKVGADFIGTVMLIFAGTATAIENQKTQGSETLIGLTALTGPCCNDCDSVNWLHLWSPSQPCSDHWFCCSQAFPLETFQAFALEFIFSFNLMFVITAVATDTRAVGELAGIAVGATVMLNILIAGETTGASMNPVRTLGPAVAARNYRAIWIYLTAPILGALVGTSLYSAVKLPDEDGNNHPKPSLEHSFRR
ncbi:unnamed protein product [Withania somnifera]